MNDTIDPPVSTRIKISGLWVSLLFIFAYVDIFSLYRLDVAQGILDGKLHIFDVSQTFLALTTVYILIPSLMVFLTLVMPPKLNRWANIIVALLYALTIVGSCIDETWIYFLLGSAVEVILLLVLVRFAWKMPG